jgi:hypothetical protein
MGRRTLNPIALGSSLLAVALDAISQMQAQSKTPYPSMAALDQYLMPDRNAEIPLARSAAPDSISHDAKVLVLGPHGYETTVEGKKFLKEGKRSCNRDGTVTATTHCPERAGFSDRDQARKEDSIYRLCGHHRCGIRGTLCLAATQIKRGPAARVDFNDGREVKSVWICQDPSIVSGECHIR